MYTVFEFQYALIRLKSCREAARYCHDCQLGILKWCMKSFNEDLSSWNYKWASLLFWTTFFLIFGQLAGERNV
ncbi:hypothetical protein AXF42_Ash013864 [Apostasia shenzhenica]|uniref:Uncharacterized protein n=1 Tax=Apostasia shenzhenica TaxID=1088818 RepID=A0A2I0AS33_9ASPA|nr:hypothetical protein AXF42_Ash013864 [Apostasia shenzhenica]